MAFGGAVANGYRSFAQGGRLAFANGEHSVAFGSGVARGPYSIVEGINCCANGSSSHAEGNSTAANGQSSHASGCHTMANGIYSNAAGYYAIADGFSSHAEGNNTSAVGEYSHAEGQYTLADAENARAAGYRCEAKAFNSTAIGRYARVLSVDNNAFVWQGTTENVYYESKGKGTFCINPKNDLFGFYIGLSSLG